MRIAILGVGLIGGSVGMAARRRLDADVVGFDAGEGVAERAAERGAIDRPAASLAAAVAGAETVFVCAPVGALPQLVHAALAGAGADCAVTDVGSTKRAVTPDDQRFVGGHPLAGAETCGIEHAREDLFEGATWYLTPTPRTSGVLLERVHRVVAALGARPTAVDAGTHDRVMAAVSHLPHVLANVLVAQAARIMGSSGAEAEVMPATGPSFRDATRVAGANTAVWRDIYLANRDALRERIDDTVRRLQEVSEALAAGDQEWIAGWNDAAADDRRALLEAGLAGGPVVELRASVPNRPGVIADIALALGRAGVNIVDMALSPSPDMRQGQVSVWVRGDEHAERAAGLIAGLDVPVVRARS